MEEKTNEMLSFDAFMYVLNELSDVLQNLKNRMPMNGQMSRMIRELKSQDSHPEPTTSGIKKQIQPFRLTIRD